MIRKAFLMSLHPGQASEYARRHRELPAGLAKVLKEHGAHNYSIFLHRETHQLFAYVEIESEERWAAIAQTLACQEWWRYMSDIMATGPDHRPASTELTEVFHLS
jgi:L-rhamnose mutarotase